MHKEKQLIKDSVSLVTCQLLQMLYFTSQCQALFKRVLLGCDHFHPLVSEMKQSLLSLFIHIYFTGLLIIIPLIPEREGLRRLWIESQQQLLITGEGHGESEKETMSGRETLKERIIINNGKESNERKKYNQIKCMVI